MQRPSGWAICKTIAAVSIPASFLQDLLQRVDIVDVVGRYVPLKKSGANFMGLCPFHGEKSPSFSVSPVKQFFHCFGCGKGGDAIAFLREHTGMEFMEAVQSLAQEVGMQVPQEDSQAFEAFLNTLGYPWIEETSNPAYRLFLQAAK